MHENLAEAVIELRRRLQLSQRELAKQIDRAHGRHRRLRAAVHQPVISRWERGVASPSRRHRVALAKIATQQGHEDLATMFRVPTTARQSVANQRIEA